MRDAARSLLPGRAEASSGGSRSGIREDAYPPRRAPRARPGGSGRDSWDKPGAASGYGASRFGTGVRDIRDDLRERLRQNGVRGEWDTSDAPPRRRRGGGDRGGPGGPDGGKRRKGSWWRHWTWKKVLTLVAALVGCFVILAAAGVAYAYSKTPIPDVQASVMQQASKVYFSDGETQVGQFGSTNRIILTYNQIPVVLRDAVVAAEDKNFWHEGGISPTGIVRAAYYDLTSSGGNLQGGSTITQQLVRNYYEGIGTTQSLSRKVKEIFVAEKLAQTKSKEWILQQYMNTVLLGGHVYGVGAAAQYYFGLAPDQLSKITASQAAMIAAMIQSPNGFSPDPKAGAAYQGLKFRWKYVLQTMQSMGTLSPQDYARTVAKFPTVAKPVNLSWGGYRGYIMQAVQNELQTTYHYSLQRINTGGLHIVTTFNKNLMNRLYATVRSADTVMRHCAVPSILSAAARATCKGLPKWVRAGAVLEDVKTGAVLAMYSGPNYNKTQYDNALQSRNQVGSSFKTYVLATAVDQGMNVQTSILDGDSPLWIPPDSAPTTFAQRGGTGSPSPGPGYYQVVNDESGTNSFGPVHVQNATALSLNTAYTDLWHRVAYNTENRQHPVVNMAKAFGVDVHASGLKKMEDQAGTALGQASLTVEEQATTIATLADNGRYHSPHVIKKIMVGSSATPTKVTERNVLSRDQAADVDWALSADTTGEGTAAGLGLTNGQPVIAKTGTTNLSQSAFFMGATTRYAMAVALFVNHPGCTLPKPERYKCDDTAALAFAPPPGLQSLFGVGGLSGYGGQYPAYIWHQFFMQNFNTLPVQNFLPVNDLGSKWNLYGTLPKPHHHQDHHGDGQGQHGGHHCYGLPPGQCHQGGPSPTPTVRPTVPPTGFPTPRPSRTKHPGGGQDNGTAATSGGAGAGAVALALVVVAGPSLPLVTRLRNRRSRARKSAERPSGG
jgi:membrane peptidoglycan carboxypeptidase